MKVYVYVGGGVATLVREGTQEEEAMRQLKHLSCEGEHECETIDEGIVWFNQWSAAYWGMQPREV